MSVSSSAVQSICSNMHDMGKQMCVGCNDGGVFLIDISNLEKPEITELTKTGMVRSEITQYVILKQNRTNLSVVLLGTLKSLTSSVLVLHLVMLLCGIFVRRRCGASCLITTPAVFPRLLGVLKMVFISSLVCCC